MTPPLELEEHVASMSWTRIAQTLGQLGFEHGEGVPSTELADFERRWAISLPDEYKNFLTAFGYDAPGPWSQLTPLGHDVDLSDGELMPMTDEQCARLKEPFRHLHRDEEEDDDEAEPVDFRVRRDGALLLSYEGCTVFSWLVLNGPYRGQVWASDVAWAPAATPLGRFVDFREWYAVWLLAQPGAMTA